MMTQLAPSLRSRMSPSRALICLLSAVSSVPLSCAENINVKKFSQSSNSNTQNIMMLNINSKSATNRAWRKLAENTQCHVTTKTNRRVADAFMQMQLPDDVLRHITTTID